MFIPVPGRKLGVEEVEVAWCMRPGVSTNQPPRLLGEMAIVSVSAVDFECKCRLLHSKSPT